MPSKQDIHKGFILIGFEKIIFWLASKTSAILGFYLFKDYPQIDFSDSYIIKSNKRVDYFNILWWLIAIFSYIVIVLTKGLLPTVILFIVVVRILNIICYQLFNIFANNFGARGAQVSRIVSLKRSLFYSIINYIELIILFASVYAKFSDHLNFQVAEHDKLAYLYFSNISQLTIGYGDIIPRGFLRFIVPLQGMIGLLVVSLSIGKFVGMIPIKEAATDNLSSE